MYYFSKNFVGVHLKKERHTSGTAWRWVNFYFWLKYSFKKKVELLKNVPESLVLLVARVGSVMFKLLKHLWHVQQWEEHHFHKSLWLWSEDIILMRADRKRWTRREHRITRERESWKEGTVKGQISTYHHSFLFYLFVIKMKEFKLQTDIKACQYIHAHHCSSNKDITCETKTSRESVWVTSAPLTYANMPVYRWYGVTCGGQIQYHVQMDLEDMSSE